MTSHVDIHAHLLLEPVLGQAGDLGPEIVYYDDGRISMRIGDRFTPVRSVDSIEQEKIYGLRGAAERYLTSVTDPLVRLAEMDERGIDILGVTNNPQMYFYKIDPATAVRFQSIANDALAEYCETAPERFFFMASLPLQDLDASVAELERAIGLGARGANIGAHSLGDHELYDEELWPIYARLEEADLPLFVHPYPFQLVGVAPQRFSGPMLEFPYQSSIAATNLMLSGAMDKFPNLRVCISHGGGFLPYQFGRIEAFAQLNPNVAAKKPLREYLPQFYFDNLIHDPVARRYLIDWAGPSNVVVGDNLGGLDSADGFAFLKELELDEAAEAAISGGNAKRLFRL